VRHIVVKLCDQANATTRAVIAEIRRTGAGTLKAIAQELETRGVRTPAGRDGCDAKQVSRLLAEWTLTFCGLRTIAAARACLGHLAPSGQAQHPAECSLPERAFTLVDRGTFLMHKRSIRGTK
jgi:hypothetical protein